MMTMKSHLVLLLPLLVYGCDRSAQTAPQWCRRACVSSGVSSYNHEILASENVPDKWVVDCKDGAFFDKDTSKECDTHGGVSRRTNIGGGQVQSVDLGETCFCKDGALFSRY